VPDAVPINHAPAPPKILWSDGAEPGELVVQIRATDRAGLLARLTAVFERDGVDIAWAKVTTLGSSVVDVFDITAVGDGNSAGAPTEFSRLIRDELEHDLYAVLPAAAPAKPVFEAS
jgi:[protein-PII] uridylyltransferase